MRSYSVTKLISSAVFAAVVPFGTCALAQSASLPAMSFLAAPLVSPTDAEVFYGTNTTHSSSFVGISGFEGQPPEIVETARALKNDPDLIFEFVHNQIEVEYAFGLRKGPLGALIEKSGTPFDQNALFVNLVRQAGYQAQYVIGEVTISAADFANWTGVSDIQAACRLLAAGGIPATFNGASSWSADCSQTGTLTSVTILHIWSQVNIGGTWYNYDPSFKSYTASPGRDLITSSGITSGQAATQAAATVDAGSQSGSNYIHNAGQANLNDYLKARGTQLLSDIKTNAADWDTDRVVGITKISPIYKPNGGWRNSSPLGYSTAPRIVVTGDIPDQYRSTLQVTVRATSTLFDRLFYVDEIDGRRLGVTSNFGSGTYPNGGQTGTATPVVLSFELDDVVIATSSCAPTQSGGVTLTATHPYAANNHTYGAQTEVYGISALASPFAIVSGWGKVSSALLAKWDREAPQDNLYPNHGSPPATCQDGACWDMSPQPSGDATNQKLGANWLSQLSRMLAIQAQLGGTKVDHQHTIGVVDRHGYIRSFQYPPPGSGYTNIKTYYGMSDQFTSLDVDTAISVTSMTNDTNRRNAVARSVAVAAATLEASVIEQMQDFPDTASTATRFSWGNQPDNEDPCFSTINPRRFYDFTGSTAVSRSGLYVYEGSPNGCNALPSMPLYGPSYWIGQLENTVNTYLTAGFKVTASAESFLGPGARFGAAQTATVNHPSVQRGGAVVATRYDASGNVTDIAHIIVGFDGATKGGGGVPPVNTPAFDPSKAADVLKDRFVDRSEMFGVDLKTGEASYTTPVLLSVGGNDAPYGLQYTQTYKSAPDRCLSPCTGPKQGGWNHNWDIRFSNSGSGPEAMGVSNPRAAAGTLVAFLTMQDIFAQGNRSDLEKDVYATLVADWWRQQMVANVATVTRGFSGKQYVRLVDNTWLSPVGSPGTLTQAGTRVKVRDVCQISSDNSATGRRWDFSGVTFALRNAGGDTLNFAPWQWDYSPNNECLTVYGYKPTTWTFPQGPSISFGYDYKQGVTSVTTSLGRSMTFAAGIWSSGSSVWGSTATSGGITVGQTQNGTTDAAGNTYKFEYTAAVARSSTRRAVPYGQLLHVFEPVNGSTPALEYTYDSRGLVMQVKDANALQLGAHGPYNWFIAEGGRGERDDPLGGAYTVYFDVDGNAVRHIDEIGREIDSIYDGLHRISSRTYPEGDQDRFGYDGLDNVVSLTKVPKPCQVQGCSANIVVHASYEPTWNKLASLIDARGNETDFTYYGSGVGASMLQAVQRPAVSGARPTYSFQYNSIGLLISETDAAGVTTTHNYDSYGNLSSTTTGTMAVGARPAVNLTTTFSYDGIGNVVQSVGPRTDVSDVTDITYDVMRRKVFEILADPDGNGPHLRPATKTIYDANGRVVETDRGTTTQASGGDFVVFERLVTTFDPSGNPVAKTVYDSNNNILNFTQSSYDANNRSTCTAIRMNPATFGGQPTDPCTLASTGSFGNDRITKKYYDAAGQILQEVRAFGSPQEQVYATNTYTLGGKLHTVTDADGPTHVTTYTYDGFNRLLATNFADGTADQFGYDANGNVTTHITREGQGIAFTFDPLDRLSTKTVPAVSGISAANTVSWTYDLAGKITNITDTLGNGLANGYDAAGRPISATNTVPGLGAKAIGYTLDEAGNRTHLTWADGYNVGYGYDALNRMVGACENSAFTIASWSCGGASLATFDFDDLGRPAWRQHPAGASADKVAYSWSTQDELLTLSHTLASGANSVAFTDDYSPAHQILHSNISNAAYQYEPSCSGTDSYTTVNALNQYPSVSLTCGGSANIGYDLNGNLTSDSTFAYGYDPENRLITANRSGQGVTYAYDPLGRRTTKSVTGGSYAGTTYFLSSGDDEIAEYDGSGALLRRYVPGPGVDQPIAMVTAAGVKTFFHQDKIGSVIAMSDTSGNLTEGPYTYDAYGSCLVNGQPCMGGVPFKYTGRRFDPETGLYYYRARYYSTVIGRFLQTDPIGYKDDLDLYAYVGNDPMDNTDPSGLCYTGSHISGGDANGCQTTFIAPDPAGGGPSQSRKPNGTNQAQIASNTTPVGGGYYARVDEFQYKNGASDYEIHAFRDPDGESEIGVWKNGDFIQKHGIEPGSVKEQLDPKLRNALRGMEIKELRRRDLIRPKGEQDIKGKGIKEILKIILGPIMRVIEPVIYVRPGCGLPSTPVPSDGVCVAFLAPPHFPKMQGLRFGPEELTDEVYSAA
jgi:RHS repeat-associated protein